MLYITESSASLLVCPRIMNLSVSKQVSTYRSFLLLAIDGCFQNGVVSLPSHKSLHGKREMKIVIIRYKDSFAFMDQLTVRQSHIFGNPKLRPTQKRFQSEFMVIDK